MPKVSVIVPIYGVERYIVRCAQSLFSQTLDDIEFIFVDDCSPDNSMALLQQEIEKNRPRFAGMNWTVRTVKMPTNSGLAAVRRHGIQLATGQFVIHCDSDDWVAPDAYKLMYEKAMEDGLDIVLCDYYRSDGVTHEYYKNGVDGLKSKDEYFRQLLTYRCSTSVWTKLVKRELYTKNDLLYPNDNMWEDFVLSIQLFYYAKKIGYLPEPLYYYYYNPSSISYSNIDKRQEQIQHNAKIILDFLEANKLNDKFKDQIVFFKYMSRSELVLFTKERKYLLQWRSTFPEVNRLFWNNKEFNIKEKLKFIVIYMGLYKFYIRTKGKQA